MKQDKISAKAQRLLIAAALTEGKGIRETARIIGCSTRTVQKVRDRMDDPETAPDHDRREDAYKFTDETRNAMLAIRRDTGLGAALIAQLVRKNPEKYGIYDPSQIPSDKTLYTWFAESKLTRKMVGRKDTRGFPIDFTDEAGIIAMDEWGPRRVQGEKIYLVTMQDRHTRLAFGLPMFRKATLQTWMRAYDIARNNLLAGAAPDALWLDNGIGQALAKGHTSQPIRYFLSNGTRIVYNAPHTPWKNGRLENWHWRQEREYWSLVDSHNTTVPDALRGLLGYINWYNTERPHGGIRDNEGNRKRDAAPADLAQWYKPLTLEQYLLPNAEDYPKLDPQAGIIDMIRMCGNRGQLELQEGETMRVSPVFAGHWLRVRFHLRPETDEQPGEVIWQRGQAKEPITVTTFTHFIDKKRERKQPLVINCRNVDFDTNTEGFKQQTQLDTFQMQKAAARIGKRERNPNQLIDGETGEVLS